MENKCKVCSQYFCDDQERCENILHKIEEIKLEHSMDELIKEIYGTDTTVAA